MRERDGRSDADGPDRCPNADAAMPINHRTPIPLTILRLGTLGMMHRSQVWRSFRRQLRPQTTLIRDIIPCRQDHLLLASITGETNRPLNQCSRSPGCATNKNQRILAISVLLPSRLSEHARPLSCNLNRPRNCGSDSSIFQGEKTCNGAPSRSCVTVCSGHVYGSNRHRGSLVTASLIWAGCEPG